VIAISGEASGNIAVLISTAALILAIIGLWLAAWRRLRPHRSPAARFVVASVGLLLLAAAAMAYAAWP